MSGKADQSALESLRQTVTSHTSTLDRKGNCRIWTTSYTGSGGCGPSNPNKLTFPVKPAVVFIGDTSISAYGMMAIHGQPIASAHGSTYELNDVTWTETTMTWNHSSRAAGQLNQQDVKYLVVALIEL